MQHPFHGKHGFTLLEMSIVLLIIALIAGGVLAGKSLIGAANLRAIMGEYDRHVKSIKEFQDKYNALPGDMVNATTYWGTAAACPIAYTTVIPTDTTTCNGDGNGQVAYCIDSLTSCTVGLVRETWLMWQHLSNAGLTEGRYTGAPGSAIVEERALIGVNAPASARRPGGWSMVYMLNPADFFALGSDMGLPGDQYGHILLYGGDLGTLGAFTTQPVLYVSEAHELDLKMDDGLPESGTMRAFRNAWLSEDDAMVTPELSFCVDPVSSIYNALPDKRVNTCTVFFLPGF
jgi:prepilin-type N-terminal cleavage/methylation domain-containing protein